MSAPDAILRAIACAEDHLRLPIMVAQMAEAASYSLYHFCRVFGKYARHTPYDYLMRRRMTEAASGVITTDRKIVDIALEFQFESHEGFTRAFQRMFSLAPAEARRQGWVPAARLLPRLTADHLACLQRQNGLVPQVVSLPEIACPRADPSIPPGAATRLAVPLAWPDVIHPYANGSLPAGEYARFTLVEAPGDLSPALDWILHTWLFYAPYDLRLPDVLIQSEGALSMLVPVQRRPK